MTYQSYDSYSLPTYGTNKQCVYSSGHYVAPQQYYGHQQVASHHSSYYSGTHYVPTAPHWDSYDAPSHYQSHQAHYRGYSYQPYDTRVPLAHAYAPAHSYGASPTYQQSMPQYQVPTSSGASGYSSHGSAPCFNNNNRYLRCIDLELQLENMQQDLEEVRRAFAILRQQEPQANPFSSISPPVDSVDADFPEQIEATESPIVHHSCMDIILAQPTVSQFIASIVEQHIQPVEQHIQPVDIHLQMIIPLPSYCVPATCIPPVPSSCLQLVTRTPSCNLSIDELLVFLARSNTLYDNLGVTISCVFIQVAPSTPQMLYVDVSIPLSSDKCGDFYSPLATFGYCLPVLVPVPPPPDLHGDDGFFLHTPPSPLHFYCNSPESSFSQTGRSDVGQERLILLYFGHSPIE